MDYSQAYWFMKIQTIKRKETKTMKADILFRILMILTGFILAMLGAITFIHSGDHKVLGLLISFAGVMSMFAALPDNA